MHLGSYIRMNNEAYRVCQGGPIANQFPWLGTDGNEVLFPGCGRAAAHCFRQDGGLNAAFIGSKLRGAVLTYPMHTWEIKYLKCKVIFKY